MNEATVCEISLGDLLKEYERYKDGNNKKKEHYRRLSKGGER